MLGYAKLSVWGKWWICSETNLLLSSATDAIPTVSSYDGIYKSLLEWGKMSQLCYTFDWIVHPSDEFKILMNKNPNPKSKLFIKLENLWVTSEDVFAVGKFWLMVENELDLIQFQEQVPVKSRNWRQVLSEECIGALEASIYWEGLTGTQRGAILDFVSMLGIHNEAMFDKQKETGQELFFTFRWIPTHRTVSYFKDAFLYCENNRLLLYKRFFSTQYPCHEITLGIRVPSQLALDRFMELHGKRLQFSEFSRLSREVFYEGVKFVGWYDIENAIGAYTKVAQHNYESGCCS